jgi:pimeloyl-ACP methyl ester carboxylesterase
MRSAFVPSRAVPLGYISFGLLGCLLITLARSPAALGQATDVIAKTQWYGEMDAGSRLFRFVVTTHSDDKDNWQGELKSLDEGGQKFKLQNLKFTKSEFSFDLPQTSATYVGTFNDQSNNDEVIGQWKQRGATLALNFRRVSQLPNTLPTETWVGELNAGFQKLTMQFRVYHQQDGQSVVYFDSVAQRAGGFKAIKVMTEDSIRFEVPSINGVFKGKLNDPGDEINGSWTQGISFDLVLRKIPAPLSPEIEPLRRPQTPKPPFPYEAREVSIENSTAKLTLSGTLTIPHSDATDTKFPVAILISGSGPQDRDETIMGHKPFFVLADFLSRRGIAVLRYDERGVGKSTGVFETATTADFAADVRSIVDFLQQHPRIDPQKIGLIGHSEGGIVAPLVASQKDDIAWIVLMASPGVNGEEILRSQGKLIIEAEGGDETAVRRHQIMQDIVISAVKKLSPDEDPHAILDTLTDEVQTAYSENGLANLSNDGDDTSTDPSTSAAVVRELVRANLLTMHSPWFRFFMTHEPGPVLEQVRCPVLAINGEKDVQVDPKLNLPKLSASLLAGGNSNVTLIEFPGLNHLFQTASSGTLSEYESIEETISITVMDSIHNWIKGQ